MTNKCERCGHIKKEHFTIKGENICKHTDENAKWDCWCKGWKYGKEKQEGGA